MADLPVTRNYDVEIPDDVKKLWLEKKVQECKSRVVRLQQDIEDIMEGRVKELQAEKRMMELTLEKWQFELDTIDVTPEK